MNQEHSLEFILNELYSVADKGRVEGMKRFAIDTKKAIGVTIPELRNIARHVKINHWLAQQLWETEIHEARILASMVADPTELTKAQMDKWVNDFYSWDICDQACGNLFQKTDFFVEKAFEYSHQEKEFVKRTGFVLMVEYAVHHKNEPDELCIQFLKRIEEEARDERNFVKKAVNWALRQIGKRNKYLHPIAVDTAYRILKQNSKSAKWIAQDAIRELEGDAVRERLSKK